jgi:hypothetical protein
MGRRHVPPVPEGLAARVQQAVTERARRVGLHAGFGEGRRATDVVLVVLKGERSEVLRHAPDLVEGLGVDQEIVRASQTPEAFELMVALMRPRAQRDRRRGEERRASELIDED